MEITDEFRQAVLTVVREERMRESQAKMAEMRAAREETGKSGGTIEANMQSFLQRAAAVNKALEDLWGKPELPMPAKRAGQATGGG